MERIYTLTVIRNNRVEVHAPIYYLSTALFLIETIQRMDPDTKFSLKSHTTSFPVEMYG